MDTLDTLHSMHPSLRWPVAYEATFLMWLLQVLEWSAQLARALKFIHEQHILHRDLKTKNIFLTRNAAKLGDFGIARCAQQAGTQLT